MSNQQSPGKTQFPGRDTPWYRQFWPWFIIALPAAAVIASFISLWLAVGHPDYLVVDEVEYQRLNGGLKAQAPVNTDKEDATGKTDPSHD